MPVDGYNVITATLALAALAIGGAVLVPSIRARFERSTMLGVALAIAVVATLGSLTYSGYFGYEPCRLCWYQRIAMYPLVWLLAVGLRRRDSGLHLTVGPLALAGLGVSIYHYALQTFPSLEGTASCSVAAPCAVRWVSQFGFVSIPFMAACGFLAIAALTYSAHRSEAR